MSRRGGTTTIRCAGGCGEIGIFEYDNRAQLLAISKKEGKWKCYTCEHESERMRAIGDERSVTLTATRDGERLYWTGYGHPNGRCSGPGFIADSDDFPEWTRITVTVRVEGMSHVEILPAERAAEVKP